VNYLFPEICPVDFPLIVGNGIPDYAWKIIGVASDGQATILQRRLVNYSHKWLELMSEENMARFPTNYVSYGVLNY